MPRVLKSFFLIINYKTLIITALAVVSTYICYHNDLIAKFPDMLVGVAIVFPVVFSIGSAYNRREGALQRFSDFKGHAIALFYATRDWPVDKNHDLPARTRDTVQELLVLIRTMFNSKGRDWEQNEKNIYAHFSRLSALTQEMRNYGCQSTELSRVSQYVSKMIIAFDNLKIIHDYRTPITLRAYSKVFIYIFPIIYGPYFASTFKDYSVHMLGYVMPILYSFILVSLDNIQDHLENPFDDVGEDDIRIEEREIIALMN